MVRSLLLIIVLLLSFPAWSQATDRRDGNDPFIWKLSSSFVYPDKMLKTNTEALVAVEFKTDKDGNICKRRIVYCSDNRFRKVTLKAFDQAKPAYREKSVEKTDTMYVQYSINGSGTPVNPRTDIRVIGYGYSNERVLVR